MQFPLHSSAPKSCLFTWLRYSWQQALGIQPYFTIMLNTYPSLPTHIILSHPAHTFSYFCYLDTHLIPLEIYRSCCWTSRYIAHCQPPKGGLHVRGRGDVFHEAILSGRRDMEPTIFQYPGCDMKLYLPRSKQLVLIWSRRSPQVLLQLIGVELEHLLTPILWLNLGSYQIGAHKKR